MTVDIDGKNKDFTDYFIDSLKRFVYSLYNMMTTRKNDVRILLLKLLNEQMNRKLKEIGKKMV